MVKLLHHLPLLAMSTRVTRSARGLANGTAARPESLLKAGTSQANFTKATSSQANSAKRKTPPSKRASEAELEESLYGRPDFEAMPPPATPLAKKAKKSVKEDPTVPPTPTPARAKLMHQTASPAKNSRNLAAKVPLDRPADPAATNAPLATPRGSRRTAYSKDEAAPSYRPKPRTDTTHLLSNACAHLCSVDPRMQALIAAHPCPVFTPAALAEPVDPYKSLVSGILAQQVSGAAAASIRRKFVALFNEGVEDPAAHTFPTPAQVLQRDIATLRTAGLSQRKAEYVTGLAEKFVAGELSAEMLLTASWEEVLEKLTAVRGLGVWSVEMFGCFALKRMDIFSTGDLGVQ